MKNILDELDALFKNIDYDGEDYHIWRLKNREYYYIIFKAHLEDLCKGRKEWSDKDIEWKAELRNLINENKKEMEESRYMINVYRGNPTGKNPFPNYWEVVKQREIKELNYKESIFRHTHEGS